MSTDNPTFNWDERPFAPFTIPPGILGNEATAKPIDPPPAQEEPDVDAIGKLLSNQLTSEEKVAVQRKIDTLPGWKNLRDKLRDEMMKLTEDTEVSPDNEDPVI